MNRISISRFMTFRLATRVCAALLVAAPFAARAERLDAVQGNATGSPGSRSWLRGVEQDFDFIQSVFESSYAPTAWKSKHVGWNLEREIIEGKAAAANATRLIDVQSAVDGFFRSAEDYHVGVSFHATAAARLPLEIRSGRDADGGRVYAIARIDRAKLSERAFPFKEGDLVQSLGGRPIDDIAQELRKKMARGTPTTDQALAELYLTRRFAAAAMDVPSGPIEIEIFSRAANRVFKRQLIWETTPEKIQPPRLVRISKSVPERTSLLRPKMIASDFDIFQRIRAEEVNNPFLIGARQSFIPALGTKIWESAADSPFHAYIYRAEGGKLIGFLRIPSYGAGEKESKAFAEIIKRFEGVTDALVIDQINNPGGSVFYLYSLVSMLTDRPMATPKHRMALTQADVAEAVSGIEDLESIKNDEEARKAVGETVGGYPVDYQLVRFFKDYYEFLIREWNAGKTLTEPYFLGIDKINPHPEVVYTKPILLLVNELDFSGGDFFPAILQDNTRATVMGVRTAGAGGYVHQVQYPNQVGIATFTYTASLAERVNLDPIENLGVTPDIAYELTEADFASGFAPYATAIKKAVLNLVK